MRGIFVDTDSFSKLGKVGLLDTLTASGQKIYVSSGILYELNEGRLRGATGSDKVEPLQDPKNTNRKNNDPD